jgi:hypothetical protein
MHYPKNMMYKMEESMFRKIMLITLLVIAVMFAIMMTGCGKKAATTETPVDTTMTAPAPADTAMAPAPAPEAPAETPAPAKK